jgi:hypothetical protein
VLQWDFWLVFALQETRLSLKRLRALVCGEKLKKHKDVLPCYILGHPSSGGGPEVAAAGRASAAEAGTAEATRKPHESERP